MLTDDQFLDHIQKRDKKPPAVLYKFTSIETARIILSSGTLRFQSPLRYNDPFDSQWDFLWPVRTPEAIQRMSELLVRAIHDPSSWPSDIDPASRDALISERENVTDAKYDDLTKNLRQQLDRIESQRSERLRGHVNDMLHRMRLCCFCEDNASILMWSHYACEHRGVVLGFNTAALESELRCPLEPVGYLPLPPELIDADAWTNSVVFGQAAPCYQGAPRDWALTKSEIWSYEHEWRFVSMAARGTLGDFEDFRFPRAALVELVLGCKINEQEAAELRTLATAIRSDIQTIAMKRHSSRFELIGTLLPKE